MGCDSELGGDEVDHMGHECRFVALAPMRNRSEVWSIGFDEDAVEADYGKEFANVAVLECDDAVDAKVKVADSAQACNIVSCAGETVENAPWYRVRERGEYGYDFVDTFAAMDDEGDVEGVAPAELLGEGYDLFIAPSAVPVEVDSYFADGHELLVLLLQDGVHGAELLTEIGIDFLGVESDGHGHELRIIEFHLPDASERSEVFVG